jgi:hypothetical protein
MLPAAVEVKSHDLTAVVEPEGSGEGGSGDIDCGEATIGVEETMVLGAAVCVEPHDLAAVVDPVGSTGGGSGDIDEGVAAVNIHPIVPHDLAAVVDPVGMVVGHSPAGRTDLGKTAARIQIAKLHDWCAVSSHDLAAIIDPIGVGKFESCIDGGEDAIGVEEAM